MIRKGIVLSIGLVLFLSFSFYAYQVFRPGNESGPYNGPGEAPQKYSLEMAKQNGDVVEALDKEYNVDRLDRFIENVNRRRNDRIRITRYTEEGDALLHDLVFDGNSIQVTIDTTRDSFGPREKKTYKATKISKEEKENGIAYSIHIENSFEYFLFFVSGQSSRLTNIGGKTIRERFVVPEGFERVRTEEGSFEQYLQTLPLKPHGTEVYYYNGQVKNRDIHEAVIDMDVGERDLQQCADAVMRLRAEFLYKEGSYNKIHFNFTNGFKADYPTWMQGSRIVVEGNKSYWEKQTGYSNEYKSFRRYMDMVFAYAGTISLAKEMKQAALSDMKIGDVFIQADPGHCVIIVDMAENKNTGEKLFMMAQSYMPAQDIHILKNTQSRELSPWYPLNFGETLVTPEWTFKKEDLKRFEE